MCEDIHVHNETGEKVSNEKYIGDFISSDGTNSKNLKERIDKGYGIVNEIVSILEEVPLGKYKILAGIKLREAMLLNGILFNSEVWYGLTEENIEKISSIDEYLLRCILRAPSKTPKETLYLETGCKPIKYIIKKRRLMYLHHIIRRPENEVIKRFYDAQKLKPSKNDWVVFVEKDKEDLKIKLNDEEIRKYTKNKFKKYLEERIKIEVFKYLMNKKEKHSKTNDLNYDTLKVQNYMKTDNNLTNDEKYFLFKLRTRMTNVKANFKNSFIDLKCKLGCDSEDNQKHIIECDIILNESQKLASNISIEYEDIFKEDSKSQNTAAKLIYEAWKIRENIIEKNNG